MIWNNIHRFNVFMGEIKRMRRRKIRLWEESGGKCYWCGEVTILGKQRGGRVPKRYATIDHLRSRHHPHRREPWFFNAPARTVLACSACNNRRAAYEEKSIPLSERWRRSGSYPRYYIARWPRIIRERLKKCIDALSEACYYTLRFLKH